jgi:tripartite-type tricarboxylate transporter receptor subunit TctC
MTHPSFPLTRRRVLAAGAAASVLQLAHAQGDYPNRTITVIVPYAPGGQGDVFARVVGERLTRALGQTMIVDNKAGASGALGTRMAAHARPDGYTLLLGQTGEIAVNRSAMKNPGYDSLADLRPIALVGNAPLVMGAPAHAPYNTLAELIAYARKNPVSYASSGTATPGHLAAAALALATKTEMTHVPYKGAGQAMTDLMGGQVQFFFSSASAIVGHIQSGKLKALAVSSSKRLPALPNVPTVAEATVPGFEFSLWGGYFAPKETPDAIVQRLNVAINRVLAEPDLHARFEAEGSAVAPLSPAQFDTFVRAEIDKYAKLVKATGAQID